MEGESARPTFVPRSIGICSGRRCRNLPYKVARALPSCEDSSERESRFVGTGKVIGLDEKLDALRSGDSVHKWESLDDRRCCILCDRIFNGRQVEVRVSRTGRVRLHCPTGRCPSTPEAWVHPGNPLLSAKAWQDWSRVRGASEKHSLHTRRGRSAVPHAAL